MVHRAVRVGALFGLLTASSFAVRAATADPFQDANVVDEIGLARLAEEAGDAALSSLLRAPTPRQRALMAVRASPHARVPEALLAPLVQLACARDPALAPEAAHAAYQIASTLSASELGAHEALHADLRGALSAFACADAEPKPRADIAALLSQAASALKRLVN